MVIITVTVIIIIMKIIDIHNHMMPYVDDGANDIEVTKKMIQECSLQDINTVFLTPHKIHQFQGNREKYKNIFRNKRICKVNVDVFLGAGIYILDKIPQINFDDFVMGNSKALLIEFSTYHICPIVDVCHDLIKRIIIILAHVERYEYLTLEDLIELKSMGVLIQINSKSLLKSFILKNKSIFYIKNLLILELDSIIILQDLKI